MHKRPIYRVVATVDDFTQFKSAKHFGGWTGLAPSQNSSGGKTKLGGITKRGDVYLRTLLIRGAKSAVMTAHKRKDPISLWLVQLKERIGWQKASVALANKNARILWCVMTRGDRFDPNHVPKRSVAGQEKCSLSDSVATARKRPHPVQSRCTVNSITLLRQHCLAERMEPEHRLIFKVVCKAQERKISTLLLDETGSPTRGVGPQSG